MRFVPNPLPPRLTQKQLATLTEPLREAEAALARLDLAGEMIPSLPWFIYAFVRKEALLSSEIEGTQATLVDVLAWEQTDQPGGSSIEDIEEVTNYVAAINAAFEQIHSPKGAPISIRLFNDCHRTLMQGRARRQQAAGRTAPLAELGRRQPAWQRRIRAPATRASRRLLGDLERYIHAEDELRTVAADRAGPRPVRDHPSLPGRQRPPRSDADRATAWITGSCSRARCCT